MSQDRDTQINLELSGTPDIRETMEGLQLADSSTSPHATNSANNTCSASVTGEATSRASTVQGEGSVTVTPSVLTPLQQGGEVVNNLYQPATADARLLTQHLSPSHVYYHHGMHHQHNQTPWYHATPAAPP